MDARYYRIFSADGEHVATVKPEHVEAELAHFNARRLLGPDQRAHAAPWTNPSKGSA